MITTKTGKGKLPLSFLNIERVIPIYGGTFGGRRGEGGGAISSKGGEKYIISATIMW